MGRVALLVSAGLLAVVLSASLSIGAVRLLHVEPLPAHPAPAWTYTPTEEP